MTTLRAREPRLHLPNVTMVVCSTLGIYWVGYRRCDTRCPLDIFGPPSHSKLTSNDNIITYGTGTMVLEEKIAKVPPCHGHGGTRSLTDESRRADA